MLRDYSFLFFARILPGELFHCVYVDIGVIIIISLIDGRESQYFFSLPDLCPPPPPPLSIYLSLVLPFNVSRMRCFKTNGTTWKTQQKRITFQIVIFFS